MNIKNMKWRIFIGEPNATWFNTKWEENPHLFDELEDASRYLKGTVFKQVGTWIAMPGALHAVNSGQISRLYPIRAELIEVENEV